MSNDESVVDTCDLCGRSVSFITRHHLVPKATHNRRIRHKYGKDNGNWTCRTMKAWLCRACHHQIHVLFGPKELEREYNSLEALRANQEVARFVEWMKDKPEDFIPQTKKKKRAV